MAPAIREESRQRSGETLIQCSGGVDSPASAALSFPSPFIPSARQRLAKAAATFPPVGGVCLAPAPPTVGFPPAQSLRWNATC